MTRLLLALTIVGALAFCLLGPAPRTHAYPEPSVAPRSWQLHFTHRKPTAIAVRDIGGELRWFWYLPYKVVNHTDRERLFLPEATIATDRGDIIPAGTGVPPAVFKAVDRQLENPLLEDPIEVIGRLLIGEDNARESVIIWPAFEHDVDEIRVFIAGLSGETQVTQHPLTGEEIVMRKTLMLTYELPGTGASAESQTITLADKRWVMR